MQFTDFNNDKTESANFLYDTIYFQAPGEKDYDNNDWDDEKDEDFDDEEFEDEAEDVDDLHEIRVDDDLNEPDGEKYDISRLDPEDDHLPEEEEF
ncbi:hypothetical protein [Mucilaginibacter sp. dw_454]|uniref:hypothetical protein n=1 Tax=Mucilaginibacter sp. dw_454 TaxID=2720079 RepID=UPI001BD38E91|nr:hypothetical protein [Mucilaginibacter sp. dw_454]